MSDKDKPKKPKLLRSVKLGNVNRREKHPYLKFCSRFLAGAYLLRAGNQWYALDEYQDPPSELDPALEK